MVIGEWPEAAMVMVLFALAEAIESLSLDRARNAIRKLMAMAPETATVKADDGRWAETLAREVAVGALVRVGPGERIPLDGEVTEGSSAVNQAPITGESMPVEKAPGDQVFAGTINGTGSFEYRVTKTADDSTLARIIHAVEEAQGSRAPTQRFVDRFARIYTPVVFALAIVVAVLPPLAFGEPWLTWVYRALVLLVIGCPCALVISTPVTVVSGLAAAAQRGILIKGGAYLEEGRKLKAVAFDKTGTITKGEPAVTDFLPQPGEDPARALGWVASLAARSDHPLSRAIAAYAEQNAAAAAELTEFEALPGRGTKGRLNGDWLYLGSHRLIDDLDVCSPELEAMFDVAGARGQERRRSRHRGPRRRRLRRRRYGARDQPERVRRPARAGRAERHAERRQPADGHRHRRPGGHRRRPRGPPPGGEADGHQGACRAVRRGRHGGRRRQRRTCPRRRQHRLRHGRGRLGHGSRDRRRGAHGRRPAQAARPSSASVAAPRRSSSRTSAWRSASRPSSWGSPSAGEATLWMAILADMGVSLLVVFNGLRLLRAKAPFSQSDAATASPTIPALQGVEP